MAAGHVMSKIGRLDQPCEMRLKGQGSACDQIGALANRQKCGPSCRRKSNSLLNERHPAFLSPSLGSINSIIVPLNLLMTLASPQSQRRLIGRTNLCHLTEFRTCFTHSSRDSHERAHYPRGHVSAD